MAAAMAPGTATASPADAPVTDGSARVRVQWRAPADCGSTDDVERQVGAVLGDRSTADAPPTTTVLVARGDVVAVDGGGYSLTLEVDDGEAVVRRTVDAPECDVLVDAAAVIIAFAIDPAGPAEPVVTEPEDPPPPEPEAEPESETPTPPFEDESTLAASDDATTTPSVTAPAPPLTPALRFSFGVEGGLDLAVTTPVGGMAGFRAGIMGPRWRLTAGALLSVPQWLVPSDRSETEGARVWLMAGELRGCGVPRAGRVEFPLCGGFAAGAMRASAERLQTPGAAIRPWAALIASGGVTVPLRPPLAVFGTVRGVVPVVRPSFGYFDGQRLIETVRAPPVGARISAGLELRLP